ncbi:hypothetical protein BDC45DRAFT_549285 [Circinella umbellata]|nr:hypothetical protein BDC45DRAFT_549285 [Circinella umbellata]
MAKGKKHGKKEHGKGRKRGGHKFKLTDTGNLESQLSNLNLCTKDISGDGNCLFRALSDQFHGYDTEHKTIRHDICQFLKENQEEYQYFVEDDQPFDYHLECMKKEGTFGGNMELAAFARMCQVDIKVYQPGLIYIIRGISESEEAEQTLHIAYHSWEHYSSVRNIEGPFSGPPEIKDIQESSLKQNEEEEEEENDLLDSKEKAVLAACPDTNIRKIRRLLRKHKGDPDKVIEVLYELPVENEEQEETTVSSCQPQENTMTTDNTHSPLLQEKVNDSSKEEKNDLSLSPTNEEPRSLLNNIHLDEKEEENKKDEVTTQTTKKKLKKLTAQQKKQLQKEKRRNKWLEENNRQRNSTNKEASLHTTMKEMYI